MKNVTKTYRRHLAVGALSIALAGGIAGTAYAASNTGWSPAQYVGGGSMMGGGTGTGWGMGYGVGSSQAMPMTAAASYLGLTPAELQARLRNGTTLAAIATAQGKSAAGLSDVLVAAMSAPVNANTNLSADQKAALLAQIKTHVAAMIAGTMPLAGAMPCGGGSGTGRMGAGMGWGMGWR